MNPVEKKKIGRGRGNGRRDAEGKKGRAMAENRENGTDAETGAELRAVRRAEVCAEWFAELRADFFAEK